MNEENKRRMNEIVERVATAIDDYYWKVAHEHPINSEGIARAAIAAMEAPSADMLSAGRVAISLGANALGVWSHMHFFATNEFPDAGKKEVGGDERNGGANRQRDQR